MSHTSVLIILVNLLDGKCFDFAAASYFLQNPKPRLVRLMCEWTQIVVSISLFVIVHKRMYIKWWNIILSTLSARGLSSSMGLLTDNLFWWRWSLLLKRAARGHFAPRTFCPKDKMPQDKMPQGHFAPGHFAQNRTNFWKVDILPQL